MADSDDEFDRRNAREKFRPERNDYVRERGREPWEDREWAGRARDRRDRFSPRRQDGSPPQVKRVKRDWDDGSFPHYDVPYGALPAPPVVVTPHPHGWVGAGDVPVPPVPFSGSLNTKQPAGDAEAHTQPPILTFKQFVLSQDDYISDEEAVKKFGDYKTDFQKQQINEFFLQHKDEEWFRSKYFPDEYNKREEEARSALKKRCKVFKKLWELNRVASVTVDIDHSDDVVKLLDAAVILMEGGTEFDLKVLDCNDLEQTDAKSCTNGNDTTWSGGNAVRKTSASSADDEKTPPRFTEPLKLESEATNPATGDVTGSPQENNLAIKKEKKRSKRAGSGDESETGSLSDSEEETAKPVLLPNNVDNSAASGSGNALTGELDDDGLEEGEERDEPKPRPLHKTQSVFLRNLPPAVTKQEIEEVCKRYPGFKRVFLQDPQPERRFLRRGWVTFDHMVNVKEICWNLNNIRVRDCEVGAIVNKELKQRIRSVNGLTCHSAVAQQDLRLAARLIQSLDQRWAMWDDPGNEKKDKEKDSVGSSSPNPVLDNITKYITVEHANSEQTADGCDGQSKESRSAVMIIKDENILKLLDKMVLYLRIVYSMDYYSAIEYPDEDEMPHRCGIMHARGQLPLEPVSQSEVNEWMTSFEHRMMPFIESKVSLSDSDMVRLGKKNSNDEVEKFIGANTQELGKDKWLCPLSGKKFKGPEFVRKHLLTKHMEKIDEVKAEVAYFNNFLKDVRRPQLPEHPLTRAPPRSSSSSTAAATSQPLPAPPSTNDAPREGYIPPPVGSYHAPLPPPPPSVGYRPPPVLYSGRRPAAPLPPPVPHGGASFPSRGNADYKRDRFPPRRDGSGPRSDQRRAANYRDLDAVPDVDAP